MADLLITQTTAASSNSPRELTSSRDLILSDIVVESDDEAERRGLAILQQECAKLHSLPVHNSETGAIHRIACHMCGNIRKHVIQCRGQNCPQVYCRNCIAKALEQHGRDAFYEGCPYCKRLCCCAMSKVASVCYNKHHCYRKCHIAKKQNLTANGTTPAVLTQPNSDMPPLWHEPHCSCSREFIDRNMRLVENAGYFETQAGKEALAGHSHHTSPASSVAASTPRANKAAARPKLPRKRLSTGAVKVTAGSPDESTQIASDLVSFANLPSIQSMFPEQAPREEVITFATRARYRPEADNINILVVDEQSSPRYPPLVPALRSPLEDFSTTTSHSASFQGSAGSFFDQCEEEFRRGLKKVNIDRIVSNYEESLKKQQYS